jgi:hypothetical protein
MTAAPRLVVRHSRVVAAMNGAMGLAVVLGALWYARANVGDAETPWMGAALVAALLGVHVWQCLQRFLDPTPVVAIGPDGLALPQATDTPIPWHAITRVGATRSMILMGGGRLDIEVDPDVFARIRLGKRMLGDPVVKMAGLPFGISVVAQGLDRRATDMIPAIEAYWPPRADPEPDDGDA